MIFFISIFIAAFSIVFSTFRLNLGVQHVFDAPAFAVVIGGTVAVAIMILPWRHRRMMGQGFKDLVFPKSNQPKGLIQDCLALIRSYTQKKTLGKFKSTGLAAEILQDGSDYLSLKMDADRIEEILMERIDQYVIISQRVANSFRSLAKYPPAFGLMGTVLGLVALMRTVTSGSSSDEIGIRMAVALIATLYGLIVSNLILNPVGEAILRRMMDEQNEARMALRAVILASEKTSLAEAKEVLNGYVSRNNRIQVGGAAEGDKAA